MAKKSVKTKSAQTTVSANQDIIGLITALVEKLVALEAKIDIVLNQLSQNKAKAPQHNVPPTVLAPQNNNARPMYKAVCADCKKGCEVPFRPSGNRPVYCKNCFASRKKQSAFKPVRDVRPEVEPAARPAAASGKNKPAAKKSAKKKKN